MCSREKSESKARNNSICIKIVNALQETCGKLGNVRAHHNIRVVYTSRIKIYLKEICNQTI